MADHSCEVCGMSRKARGGATIKADIKYFLAKINLEQHEALMKESGFDELEFLAGMHDSETEEMRLALSGSMSIGHWMKFRRALKQLAVVSPMVSPEFSSTTTCSSPQSNKNTKEKLASTFLLQPSRRGLALGETSGVSTRRLERELGRDPSFMRCTNHEPDIDQAARSEFAVDSHGSWTDTCYIARLMQASKNG